MGKWHFRAIKGRFEELDVTGAYDIRPEANEEARAESLRVYNSAEEIFADPNIDVVIIATPNDSHKDYILGALAANKHVVCEKPVVLSSEDSSGSDGSGKTLSGTFHNPSEPPLG